jgi:hypothetical protein
MKTRGGMEIQFLAFTVALNASGWSADVLATSPLVLDRQEVGWTCGQQRNLPLPESNFISLVIHPTA